jgi:hypothetical protein
MSREQKQGSLWGALFLLQKKFIVDLSKQLSSVFTHIKIISNG